MCCDVDLKNLPGNLTTLRVERKELLVGGDRIRHRGRGQVDGLYGVLLRGTKEPGDYDHSEQIGSDNFISRAVH